MERNYVAQDVFDVEIRRLDRQDGDTEARMKERISYQLGRISGQIDMTGREMRGMYETAQHQIEKLSVQQSAIKDDIRELYGDIRELKGEVSGLKDSIEGLKHFMTWGLTLIGLLVVIAQVLAKVIQ